MPASAIRSLFVGELPEALVVPFPELSPEEAELVAMLRDAIGRFAAEHVDPRAIEKAKGLSDEIMDGLAELGLFGLLVPEAYGGLGLTTAQYGRVCEDLMVHDGALAIMSGGHSTIGIKALLRHGTEEQRARWLPRLASGELKAAFALSEAGAGTDAQALRTTARLAGDGGTYVLDGEKLWITNGGFADLFTVFARTPDHPREDGRPSITAFLVERGPGLTAGPEEDKLGLLGSSTCPILLEGCRVPRGHILGEVGRGFRIALSVLNEGRLGLAGNCLGAARFLLEQASAYTSQRHQFGRPIGSFALVQEKLGRMAFDVHALACMLHLSTHLADRDDCDIALEGAAAKILGTEVLWSVVNDAMQCAGGNGFTADYPYERMMRDARVNMIFEGTNEILRVMIAQAGLSAVGRALPGAECDEGPGSYARRVAGAEAPDPLAVPAALGTEAVGLSMGVTGLASSAARAVRAHGPAMAERQLDLARLADQAVALFSTAAILSHAAARGDEATLLLARGAARRQLARARAANSAMADNDDETLIEAARAVSEHAGLPGGVR